MKKYFKIVAATLAAAVMLTACTMPSGDSLEAQGGREGQNGRISVVTTIFANYDFVRQIAGDTAEVQMIIPPGMEAHAYEPTPKDLIVIQNADVFIYTSAEMEPWAEKLASAAETTDVLIIESAKGITDALEDDPVAEGPLEEDDDHEDLDHDHDMDPHVWLDPVNAQIMVDTILDGLIEVSPEKETELRENAHAYKEKLQALHGDILSVIEKTELKTIFSGGHFAFGHFIERYGLEYESPFSGFAPDAEPTPKRIAELIDEIRDSDIPAIYYEELVDPRIARIVAEETGVEMLMLHAAHNVTKEELQSGVTYIDIMRMNLESLKKGLRYHDEN